MNNVIVANASITIVEKPFKSLLLHQKEYSLNKIRTLGTKVSGVFLF